MNRFVFLLVLAVPFSVFAFADFGGWVTNVPSAGGKMKARATSGWVYPPCLNAVEEVNLKSPTTGKQSPPVLLQFIGNYTYSAGPARLPGQQIIGKYAPAMVCIAIKYVPCGFTVCPIPLPLFTAPLILWNGSSPR